MSKPFDNKRHPRENNGRFTLNTTGRDHIPTEGLGYHPTTTTVTTPSWSHIKDVLTPRVTAIQTLRSGLTRAGLSTHTQQEVIDSVHMYLNDEGNYPVETPMWEPTPPEAVKALQEGNIDVYYALTTGVDTQARVTAVNDIAWDFEHTWVGSGAPIHAFMTEVSVTTDSKSEQGELEDVYHHQGQTSGHAFRARVGNDFRIQPGRTTTVGELRHLVKRLDRDPVIRSFDDLIVATYMNKGVPKALNSGRYSFDTNKIANDIFHESFNMEDEGVYQAYALLYSGGMSQDSGWDAEWTPADSDMEVITPCVEWLKLTGRTTSGFGKWATRTADGAHIEPQ